MSDERGFRLWRRIICLRFRYVLRDPFNPADNAALAAEIKRLERLNATYE
jgi:hypothetical protein